MTASSTRPRTALIGHTGFIGSNINAVHTFDAYYNSANLHEIRGQHFDLVVSAAGRADSHRINADPDSDRREIDELLRHICTANIDKLSVMSTVCVYPGGSTPDEDAPITEEGLLPYGTNRAYLERRLSEAFDTLVARLPQLYGRNLKKGIVHDLLNDYRVEHIAPSARFQFYNLTRLWSDLQLASHRSLRYLNLATPPLTSGQIAREVFGLELAADNGPVAAEPYTKDLRTKYYQLFGGPPGYLMTTDEVLADLRAFVSASRSRTEG